ncbi:MAG: hypothetical protein JO297_18240 [Nitrososphaeraceae archaeon]|nr:hypothetical protein [Nitrososphaeraceae archaeon]
MSITATTAVTVISLSPAQNNSCNNNVGEETTMQTYPVLGYQLSSAIGYSTNFCRNLDLLKDMS